MENEGAEPGMSVHVREEVPRGGGRQARQRSNRRKIDRPGRAIRKECVNHDR